MYTPEVLKRINELRQKALDGTYTITEMQEFMLKTRTARLAAGQTPGGAVRRRRSKEPVNVDALLDSLDALK